jgi:hypothetical protein
MKRLEDIPKKNIFETPEGYFDELPGIIQSRIVEKSRTTSPFPSFGLALRYAVPVLAIAIALFFVFRSNAPLGNPDELLASVSTEELTYYLVESDFTTDELLDLVDLSDEDINALNDEILYPELDSELLEEYADDLLLEI